MSNVQFVSHPDRISVTLSNEAGALAHDTLGIAIAKNDADSVMGVSDQLKTVGELFVVGALINDSPEYVQDNAERVRQWLDDRESSGPLFQRFLREILLPNNKGSLAILDKDQVPGSCTPWHAAKIGASLLSLATSTKLLAASDLVPHYKKQHVDPTVGQIAHHYTYGADLPPMSSNHAVELAKTLHLPRLNRVDVGIYSDAWDDDPEDKPFGTTQLRMTAIYSQYDSVASKARFSATNLRSGSLATISVESYRTSPMGECSYEIESRGQIDNEVLSRLREIDGATSLLAQ